MKLHYYDTVHDRNHQGMRVKVVLEHDGDGQISVHRVLDAEGLAHRAILDLEDSEDAYDVRAVLSRTVPEELERIWSERETRWSEAIEQEEGFAADIAFDNMELAEAMRGAHEYADTVMAHRPWRVK